MESERKKAALDYHENPRPGKTAIVATKPTNTQQDLALCYSPGVAEPAKEIANNPSNAYRYTNLSNLVGIISNGTAVLGLGNIGPLASKPIMEGKAVLFKHFADIDVFDIEIDCQNTDELIQTIINIAPTFGAINLEDIKAPECFVIEETLVKRLPIPVFHDDQHGTAIVIAAALLNALEIANKSLSNVKIVCAGAGAAGIATINQLIDLGASRENILLVDREGVISSRRTHLNPFKKPFAIESNANTLADALSNADVFIGVAGPGLMTPDMLLSMANNPIVFALSNPTPEIMPEVAKTTRPDVIIATGRSDYPNQVNNALCFPYIFRGALDVRASQINREMRLATIKAIQSLTKLPVEPNLKAIYGSNESFEFGKDYLLPKLMDPRLRHYVSKAVAEAAIATGVAQFTGVKQSDRAS